MKRPYHIILACIICFALSACKANTNNEVGNEKNDNTDTLSFTESSKSEQSNETENTISENEMVSDNETSDTSKPNTDIVLPSVSNKTETNTVPAEYETLTFEMMTSPHKKKVIKESNIIEKIINNFNNIEKTEYDGMPAPGTLFRIYTDDKDLFSYCNGYIGYDGKWWKIDSNSDFASNLLSLYEKSNAEEVLINS